MTAAQWRRLCDDNSEVASILRPAGSGLEKGVDRRRVAEGQDHLTFDDYNGQIYNERLQRRVTTDSYSERL